MIWEDDAIEETELIHKLVTDFDFIDANNATQKTLQKIKESEKDAGGNYGGDQYDDDFDDDFDGYKQETKKPSANANTANNVEEESKVGDDIFQVTGTGWSCNGACVAAAFGKTDHVSWCEHQSTISLWNIFRRDFSNKKPNVTIEVPNCLTCIEFHPTNPLIIAGATVNGEIFVWKIQEDQADNQAIVISKSEADEYFHREPIRRIIWLPFESMSSLQQEMCLVTISGDGKILMWQNPMKNLRYPIKGHLTARVQNNKL